jgi:hypothetical protein
MFILLVSELQRSLCSRKFLLVANQGKMEVVVVMVHPELLGQMGQLVDTVVEVALVRMDLPVK